MRRMMDKFADKIGAIFNIPPQENAKKVLIEVADKYPLQVLRAFKTRASSIWRQLINIQRRVLGSRDRKCITVISGCRIRLINDYTVQVGEAILRAEPLGSLPLTLDERAAFLFTSNQDEWYDFMVHRLGAMKGAPPLPAQTVEGYYGVIDKILATHGIIFPKFIFDLAPPEEPLQAESSWPREDNPLIAAYIQRTLGAAEEEDAKRDPPSPGTNQTTTTSSSSSSSSRATSSSSSSLAAASSSSSSHPPAAQPASSTAAMPPPRAAKFAATYRSSALPPEGGAYGGHWYVNPLAEGSPTKNDFDPSSALWAEEKHLMAVQEAWASCEYPQPRLSYYDLPDTGYKPLDPQDDKFSLENAQRVRARCELLPRLLLNMIPGVRELDTQGEYSFREKLRELVHLGQGDIMCGNLTLDLNTIRSQFKPPEGYMREALPPRKTVRVAFGAGTFDFTDDLEAAPHALLPDAATHFDKPHSDPFGAMDIAAGRMQPLFTQHALLRSRSRPFAPADELTPAGAVAFAVKKDGVLCTAFRWQMAYDYVAVGLTLDETEEKFVKTYGLAYYDAHFSADLTDCRGKGDCVFRAIAALLGTSNLDIFNVARAIDKTVTLDSLTAHHGLTGSQIMTLIQSLHVRTYVIHMRLSPARDVGIAHVRTVYDFPVTYRCPQGHMSMALCLCESTVAHACVMYGAPEEPMWEGPVPNTAGLPDGCDHAHDKPSQRSERSANSKAARQHQQRGRKPAQAGGRGRATGHSKRWKKGPRPKGPQPGQMPFKDKIEQYETAFPIFEARAPPAISPSMARQIQRGGLNLALLAPCGLSPDTPAELYSILSKGNEWAPYLPFPWEYNAVTVQVKEDGTRIFDGEQNRRYVTVGWRRLPDLRSTDDVRAALLQGERDARATFTKRAPGWEVKLLRDKEIPPGRYSETGLLTPEGEFILFRPLPLNIIGVDVLRRLNWLVLPEKIVARYNKLHTVEGNRQPRKMSYYSKNLRIVNQEGRLLGPAGIDDAVLHNRFGKDFYQDTRLLFLAMGYDMSRHAIFTEDPLYIRWLDSVFASATDSLGAAFNPNFRWRHTNPKPMKVPFIREYHTRFEANAAPQSMVEVDAGDTTAMRAKPPVYEAYVGKQGAFGFKAETQVPTRYAKNEGHDAGVLVHISGQSRNRKFILTRVEDQRFVKSLLQDAALADAQKVHDCGDPLNTYGPAVAYSFYLSCLAREHNAPPWFYSLPARRQNPFKLRIERLPPRYEIETAAQRKEREVRIPQNSRLMRRSSRITEALARAPPPTTGLQFKASDTARVSQRDGGVALTLPVNQVNRTVEVAPAVAREIQQAMQDPQERGPAMAAFETIYHTQAEEPLVVPRVDTTAQAAAQLQPGGRLCACRSCHGVMLAQPDTPCPAGSSHQHLQPAYAHIIYPCPMCATYYCFQCPQHATGDGGATITLTYDDVSQETVVKALNGNAKVDFVGAKPGAYDNTYRRLANLTVYNQAPKKEKHSADPFRYVPQGAADLARAANALPEEADGKVGPKRLRGHENVEEYDEQYMVQTLGDMPCTAQREVGLPPIADKPKYKKYYINGYAFTATQAVDKTCLFIDRRMFAQGGEMAQAAMEAAYIKAVGSIQLTAEEIQRQRAVTYFIARHLLISDQQLLDLILPRNLITEAIRGAQAVDGVVQNLTGSSVTQLVHSVADAVAGK